MLCDFPTIDLQTDVSVPSLSRSRWCRYACSEEGLQNTTVMDMAFSHGWLLISVIGSGSSFGFLLEVHESGIKPVLEKLKRGPEYVNKPNSFFENKEIQRRVLTYKAVLKRKKMGLQIEDEPTGTDQS